MTDARDDSLSPLTSPRSRSPRAFRKTPNGTASSHSPTLYLPLRAAHSSSDQFMQDKPPISDRPPSIRLSSPTSLSREDGTPERDTLSTLMRKDLYNGTIGSPHARRASDGFSNAHENEPPVLPGSVTPPGRRSVQFSRGTEDMETPEGSRSRPGSLGGEKGRTASLYSKLKALAGTQSLTHSRSASGNDIGGDPTDKRVPDGSIPPNPEEHRFPFPETVNEEGSDIDADAEESAAEGVVASPDRRRRRRDKLRLQTSGSNTAPTSPKSASRPTFLSAHSMASMDGFRPHFGPRRATATEMSPQGREGVSEDEGRDRMTRESPWRRRSAWGINHHRQEGQESPDTRRPGTLRRFTGMGGEGPETPGGWRRHKAERGTSLSAQKWRQLRAGLKLMGQRKKTEKTIDYQKSAELLNELTAITPAAVLLASMFQRDEHGSKRVPVLLEQLKVSVTDSEVDKYNDEGNPLPGQIGEKHQVFRIELEYGNGMTRMKWIIKRSLRDFANLHLKYKVAFNTQKYVQLKRPDKKNLPRFPRTAFPYLKGIRGMESEEEDEDDDIANETEGVPNGNERPGPKRRRRSSYNLVRKKSNAPGVQDSNAVAGAISGAGGVAGAVGSQTVKREAYPERQRRKLEVYLQQMIKFMLFRPDANRLCKFLEISALGMRLAAEGTYHGKEGLLIIQSSKGLDFRKTLTPSNIKGRHLPKWFLVRHSYVVCVDSPEEMHIYDVFMLDSDFQIQGRKTRLRDQNPKELAKTAGKSAAHPQHHRLKLRNSERKLKLLARSERQLHQFEDSIQNMIDSSPWSKSNRFDSFAPVRQKCFAQWLVDGRDHMWVVSRAISQARDVIYIHDWWLSPELYMRRPAAISQKWRLDRLLKRKAEQGVKVFVIMYRNIESAIPIDSEYTKFSLLDLHPNVFVQRSPNQFRQNTFFWAHHEKLCIVDHTLAFVGGIDLCFGRWDTPQHTVVDDKLTGFEVSDMPKDADHCQLWPGKDYSNPRVQDFYALDKPYEEMYDRSQVARMPWHDISMQVVGQPARDLTRHFVQRWNYILRQRKPTRPTPFLLPPPDFVPAELEALGLDGTCEVQILRSSGTWSMGTPNKTEHSIMNAYVKMIEDSEHFVYIENQFFISSCEVETTRIENHIGDALVERIIRASKNEEEWRAIVVIPLVPGFQNTVDSEGGTSIRLIMQCQYRSICRGESSIFGRLRAKGIDPEEYIQFFSLRSWGKIGPKKQLVTEQLYIHAKCMIVDDRVAIIGSANINERSMLGNRDSECAAIVRDTDMLESTMKGEPYLVGRFPHTLRMRLMREHLGIDVDEIMEDAQVSEAERKMRSPDDDAGRSSHDETMSETDSTTSERQRAASEREQKRHLQEDFLDRTERMHPFNHDIDWEQADNPNLKSNRKLTQDVRVTNNEAHRTDVAGKGSDNMEGIQAAGFDIGRDSTMAKGTKEVLISDIATEGKRSLHSPLKAGEMPISSSTRDHHEHWNPPLPPRPDFPRLTTAQLGLPVPSLLPSLPALDDTDIGGPAMQDVHSKSSTDFHHPLAHEIKQSFVDKDCMRDPLHDAFYLDTWQNIAENNTKIYRAVFRCMPDNEVKTWKDYNEYNAYFERFQEMQGNTSSATQGDRPHEGPMSSSGPPGAGSADPLSALREKPFEAKAKVEDLKDKLLNRVQTDREDKETAEKEKLKNWAAEANRAQFDRQEKKLSKHDTFASTDEKAALNRMAIVHEGNATEGEHGENAVATGPILNEKSNTLPPQFVGYSEALNMNVQPVQKRRRRATTKSSRQFHASDDIISYPEAEELLNMVQGHVIIWPYEWLAAVEAGGNWLFALDQISPLEIYT